MAGSGGGSGGSGGSGGGGDPASTPLRSEARGLLVPEGLGQAHRGPGPASWTRAESVLEAALLGFAATVPISIAAAQILLAVFLVAWLAGWRRVARPAVRSETAPGHARPPRHAWPRTAVVALGLLFAGEILAALVNRAPSHVADPFRKHGVLLALPALAAVAARRPIFYRRVLGLAVVCGAVVAFYAIGQHFTGVDALRNRMLEPYSPTAFVATGAFGHHLTYGGSVMLLLLAAVVLAFAGSRWRSLPALLVLPLGLALLWSYARSAWGGAAAGLLALLTLRRGRSTLAVAAVAVAFGVIALAADPTVRFRVEEAFRWQGMPPRLRLWQAAVRMLADHPLGIGPGRFDELFMDYWTPGRIHSTVHAHSDPLRAALDGGPLGLAGYLGLAGGALLGAARGLRRRVRAGTVNDGERRADLDPHSDAAARRDLLTIALAASSAFLVSGIFQTYFWDQEDVMLWMLLVAPALAAKAPEPTDE